MTTRRLAAILAADVVGYSRLIGLDEVATLQALKAHRREVVDPAIAAHRGRKSSPDRPPNPARDTAAFRRSSSGVKPPKY
jgi:class 3 adenylate cyclase